MSELLKECQECGSPVTRHYDEEATYDVPILNMQEYEELLEDLRKWDGDTLLEKVQNAIVQIHTAMDCAGCGKHTRVQELLGGACIRCWQRRAARSGPNT